MPVLSSSAESETCSRMITTQPYDASDHDSGAWNASIRSCITSATRLVTKATEFADWARSIKLDPVIKIVVPDVAELNPIRDIQVASTTIPSWLKNPDSPEFGHVFPVLLKWRNIMCSTLQQSGSRYSPSLGKDEWLYYAVHTILAACHNHEIIKSCNNGSERAGRPYLDELMNRSCYVDSSILMRYSVEWKRTLRLPRPISTPDIIRVPTVTASGVTFLPIANFRPHDLSPEFRTAVSAFADEPETSDLMFIHFVAQYNRMGSSENRMKMAMASALQQKKILGLQGQFVFGVFQFNSDFLQVNAGRWMGDEMKIYKIGTYTFKSPASLVEFALAVRKINQLAEVYRDQLMEAAPVLQRAVENKRPVDEWAPMHVAATHEDFERLSESEHWEEPNNSEHSEGESSDPEHSGESDMEQGEGIHFTKL
ncbi:unnamed protein product [Rhizoctonia solani]|uniref:Uncharacterized protein n=1 Tax=Rhizoctonia solani TaxID=456999 RepID=A0A8H2XED3_9AGAM|nr:unnamed protein product [Rhizoctonia solani]